MFDWKVIVAGLVAVLLVSSVLVGDFGIKDIFSGTVNKISEWLGSSPFGGLFPSPETSHKEVVISLYPESFILVPETTVDISLDSINFTNFKGKITTHFQNNTICFEESAGLNINMPIQRTKIKNVKIRSIKLENIRYRVVSGESDITNENGTIEITSFSGTVVIEGIFIEFIGNISLVKGSDWSIS